ncbi:MAG: outer membrane lipoprotein-sorting protein [Terracidiphilus sp.]
MNLPCSLLAAFLAFALPAHAADAAAAIAASRDRVHAADFRATGHLVRVDASGARTSDGITIKGHWFPGVLRVMVEITSPANARAHILLEMHPNGQTEIQIAHPGDKAPTALPFDKWIDGPLGPGFSYEDFLEPQFFWPTQTFVESTKYGARDCDVFKSLPGTSDRTHYAEVKSWLDHTIAFPVYVEKTLKGTGAVKEFTSFGLRHDGGVWSATQLEVKTRDKTGSTLLIIDRGSPKANLSLGDFSPEQLIRF